MSSAHALRENQRPNPSHPPPPFQLNGATQQQQQPSYPRQHHHHHHHPPPPPLYNNNDPTYPQNLNRGGQPSHPGFSPLALNSRPSDTSSMLFDGPSSSKFQKHIYRPNVARSNPSFDRDPLMIGVPQRVPTAPKCQSFNGMQQRRSGPGPPQAQQPPPPPPQHNNNNNIPMQQLQPMRHPVMRRPVSMGSSQPLPPPPAHQPMYPQPPPAMHQQNNVYNTSALPPPPAMQRMRTNSSNNNYTPRKMNPPSPAKVPPPPRHIDLHQPPPLVGRKPVQPVMDPSSPGPPWIAPNAKSNPPVSRRSYTSLPLVPSSPKKIVASPPIVIANDPSPQPRSSTSSSSSSSSSASSLYDAPTPVPLAPTIAPVASPKPLSAPAIAPTIPPAASPKPLSAQITGRSINENDQRQGESSSLSSRRRAAVAVLPPIKTTLTGSQGNNSPISISANGNNDIGVISSKLAKLNAFEASLNSANNSTTDLGRSGDSGSTSALNAMKSSWRVLSSSLGSGANSPVSGGNGALTQFKERVASSLQRISPSVSTPDTVSGSVPQSEVRDPAIYGEYMTRNLNIEPPSLRKRKQSIEKLDRAADEEFASLIKTKRLVSKTSSAAKLKISVEELVVQSYPKYAIPPEHGLIELQQHLTPYEEGEIQTYQAIYFAGKRDIKKIPGTDNKENNNHGFDDDNCDYKVIPGDHIGYRFEIIDILGKGSFGLVLRCIDHKNGGLSAVKIIRNKKRFHTQAIVEIKLLKDLLEWDADDKYSFLRLTDHFHFRHHLCISTELLSINLYELIKANEFKGFSYNIVRRFTKQVLESLAKLHEKKVIHCDLKPENILLEGTDDAGIRVIDFGSSCYQHEKVYTYIQSRFYRSPEVIMGIPYTLAIDMWSLGCIICELFCGYPLFPGRDEQEQMALIMQVIGIPDRHLIEKSSRKNIFFHPNLRPKIFLDPTKHRQIKPSTKSLQQALNSKNAVFIDFISKCLTWDPTKRQTPEMALNHDFITGLNTMGLVSQQQSQPQPSLQTSAAAGKRVAAPLSKSVNSGRSSVKATTPAASAHAQPQPAQPQKVNTRRYQVVRQPAAATTPAVSKPSTSAKSTKSTPTSAPAAIKKQSPSLGSTPSFLRTMRTTTTTSSNNHHHHQPQSRSSTTSLKTVKSSASITSNKPRAVSQKSISSSTTTSSTSSRPTTAGSLGMAAAAAAMRSPPIAQSQWE